MKIETRLYRAQTAAGEVFDTSWFPTYSAASIDAQEGLTKGVLRLYSKGQEGAAFVGSALKRIANAASRAFSAGDELLGGLLCRVMDAVYPINPINGERHLVLVPRAVEQALGDFLFYPMVTQGMRETHELLPGTNERIADRVNQTIQRLTKANGALLNPKEETTQFHYRAKTISSSQINAFAVPAGGMVVFTQIVKELHGAIQSGAIRETTVSFADGSTATVDLRGVTLDDVLGALMGHEMTHVASRHSMVALVGHLVRSLLMNVGRIVLILYLKNSDEEYRKLSAKRPSELNETERETLRQKEELYSKWNDFFLWAEDQIQHFTGLFNSRKNEYEADVTGAYFAHQAGLNPLGSIYLQELLKGDEWSDLLHKNLEFLFTHPHGDNRKRALLAALHEIDPEGLKGRVAWNIADRGNGLARVGRAFEFARERLLPIH